MAKPRQLSQKAKAAVNAQINAGPPVREITLYWVDERVRAPKAIKVHPIRGRAAREVSVPRGTLFNPGVARYEGRDPAAILAWLKSMLAKGWINEVELQERQTLMRRLIRAQKAQVFAAPDPAKTAGVKKSGKGEKPRRPVQMDRRMPQSVRNNGTIVRRTINGFEQVG